jgi:hypothetical protein
MLIRPSVHTRGRTMIEGQRLVRALPIACIEGYALLRSGSKMTRHPQLGAVERLRSAFR